MMDALGRIKSEAQSIDEACKLQDRLGLHTGLKIDLLNGEPDAVVIVFNQVLEEIDLLRSELMG